MKNFKRILSLVLVFAMLASFAGMTGYVPSIVANAADAVMSGTAPLDTKAGKNTATIDVPPVMYKDSNGNFVGTISSASGGATLDTTVDITLPTVKSATLKVVSFDSDSTVFATFNLGSGANAVDFSGKPANTYTQGGRAYMILRLDYTVTVDNTPYNTKTNNILDTKFSELDTSKTSYAVYDSYGDKTVARTVDVTYTQYMAVYVTTLPRYYQVGWQTDAATKYNDAEQSLAGVIMLDMAPALKAKGVNLYGALRVGESDDHTDAALRENTLVSKGNLSLSGLTNALIWYNDERKTSCGEGSGVYTSGQFSSSGANTSNRTLGGTIYYDSYYSSLSVDVNMQYDFTSSGYACDNNGLDGFWLTWSNNNVKRAGYEVTQDGVAGTYLADGITSHSNNDADDANGLASYSANGYTVFTKTGGTYPNSGMNFQSSNTTVYFSFNLKNATASGNPYWRCVQQINRPISEAGLYGLMKTNLRVIWGFHLDAIAVPRETEHQVINAAITKNFVEAEMDPTWWNNYRSEVLFAYFDCGDLQNIHGVKPQFDGLMADGKATDAPIYKTVNFSELEAAILRAPDYDRGSALEASTGVPDKANVGAKFYDVVKYQTINEPQYRDPAGNDYWNDAVSGNGVNNLTDPSHYRYSGAYFYTDDTWRTYATERYYAVNINKYPSSSAETFWYGGGWMIGNTNKFSYTYLQSHIDAATTRLNNAYNALQLRKLDALKMRDDYNLNIDTNNDGVLDKSGAFVYNNGTQVIGYDAILTYLESLIPYDKVTFYNGVEDTDGDGFADRLTESEKQLYDTSALENKLATIRSTYSKDQTVVEAGIAFEADIKDFYRILAETKANPVASDTSAWVEIYRYINRTLCGDLMPEGGLIALNFVTEVSKIYTLTQTEKNHFQNLIDAYNAAAAANPTGVGQEAINTNVNNFFEALKAAFPSTRVQEAAAAATGVATNPNSVFEVYAPNLTANDKSNSIYHPDSVLALEVAVAEALNLNSYVFKDTTWQSLVDRHDEIVGWAKFESEGGMLRPSKAVLTYLNIALSNAQAAIADDKNTITVTSPDGITTVTHDKFTAQSVAELEFVIAQAQGINPNLEYTSQLEVDKLTFALWDETDDTKGLLLTSDTGLAPRVWSYDDSGKPTGYTDQWGDVIMRGMLYGERQDGANGTDEGLKFNTAYFDFLDKEITTPYTGEDGKPKDSGLVWDENGVLLGVTTKADGTVEYTGQGATIFDSTLWGEYWAAYKTAVELSRNLTTKEEEQATVNAAAKTLYDARNALTLQVKNFPSNTEDFAIAQGLYQELAKYALTTPITRYTVNENGTVSSHEENVNLYIGIDGEHGEEFLAMIDAFYADYASTSSTKPFDSLDDAYADKAIIDAKAEEFGIIIRKTNDPALRAGAEDLVKNFIAGTEQFVTDLVDSGVYTAGSYDSDLIAKTADDWTANDEGVYSWTNSSQGYAIGQYLGYIYNRFSDQTDVTADFGSSLKQFTDDLFTYTTTTPATDLQFAVEMRDNELYTYLGTYFYSGEINMYGTDLSFYYGDRTDDEETGLSYNVKQYVFNQALIEADIKSEVEKFFNKAESWPAIYQVNGMSYQIGDICEITDYTYEDGSYVYSGTADSDTSAKIIAILNQVGSHSSYYTDVLDSAYLNTYVTEHYTWFAENIFYTDPETNNKYVLAAPSVAQGGKPAAYNMSYNEIEGIELWYTEGKGFAFNNGNKYYLYQGNDAITSSSYNSWFTDGSFENAEWVFSEDGVMETLMNFGFGTTELKNKKIGTVIMDDVGGTKGDFASIAEFGWSRSIQENLAMNVANEQWIIDSVVTTQYGALQALELVKAIDAYRNVVKLYYSVVGLGGVPKVVDYIDGTDHIIPDADNEILDSETAVFYRENDTEGLADIDRLKGYDINLISGADSITGSEYLRGETNALPTWYADDAAMAELAALYESFAGNLENLVTIDRADEVYGTYTETNQNIMSQFIDKFAALNLSSLNYEKLNALLAAFFANYTETIDNDGGTKDTVYHGLSKDMSDKQADINEMTEFKNTHGLDNDFYSYDKYTTESIQEVLNLMYRIEIDGVAVPFSVISDDLYTAASVDTYVFHTVYSPDKIENQGGEVYTEIKDQNVVNAVHDKLAEAINTLLVLKPAKLDDLSKKIIEVKDAIAEDAKNEIYDKEAVDANVNNLWDAFIAELNAAYGYYTDEGVTPEDGLTILDQDGIDDQLRKLKDAFEALRVIADRIAPTLTVGTAVSDMEMFYDNQTIVDMDNSVENTDDDPSTGTFIIPMFEDNEYQLRVYTNETNPRILIQLGDEAANAALVSKPERLSITAKKTSGTVADVITGSVIDGSIEGSSVVKTENVSASTSAYVETYKASNAAEYNTNSSVFAILAPQFVSGNQEQAVKYVINGYDSASAQEGSTAGSTNFDRMVEKIHFNTVAQDGSYVEESVPFLDTALDSDVSETEYRAAYENKFTVYVYYMNNMPESGNDEGIVATNNVPSVDKSAWGDASYVSYNDEFTTYDTWKSNVLLTRKFNSVVASWEFIDANVNGIINPFDMKAENMIKGPVYNDPTFADMNVGSFMYVLDPTFDADIIAVYEGAKATDADTMDYAAATVAKKAMIDALLDNPGRFDEMKNSSGYARYGAYTNWALTHDFDKGDLVFVHVVDRWGNFVNRIIEITKLDEIKPVVTTSGVGMATIVEEGGAQISNIGIWNYVDNVFTEVDDVTVEETDGVAIKAGTGSEDGLTIAQVSGNVFTVGGLIPGYGYEVGCADRAGNSYGITVKADDNGCIEITVNPSEQEDDEPAAQMTFSLNSFAMITLNTGATSSVVDVMLEGNVMANKNITHYITTQAGVTQLKVVNLDDGTEKIFTPDNTTVKANDDGTLKWATKHNLTEGKHNFKVYAMTDGKFETVGVKFELTATSKTVSLTFTVVGVGRTVFEYSGAAPATSSTYKTVTVPYGSKVKITAQQSFADSNFYYWQNDETNRIITTANTMEYTAVTNADYNALFTNSASLDSGMKLVIYVNNAKNVIKTFELYEGDSYTVPAGPTLPDYAFQNWSMTKEEVLSSDKDTVIVEPVYVLAAENTVTITEGNYTTSGAGVYTSTDNARALVSINASATNEAGEEFLYWFDEGTKDIVSYSRAYAFICMKNVVLTPVYGDASTITVEPIVRITEVKFDATSGKANFYAERSIDEDFILHKTGIILTRSAEVAGNDDDFVLGASATGVGYSNETTPYGTYSANIKLAAHETVWARAFAICETADGEFIEVYGDVVSYTNG